MTETVKPRWVVDFPTLADLWDTWVQAHCRVPDGDHRGQPLVWSDWQFWCAANFGRIRDGLEWDGTPLKNQAFQYRLAVVVAPQKTGKGPWAATMALLHALGPVEFDGWAEEGEVYLCSTWGCECGFTHAYRAGEPKGRPHPSPLIQLTARSKSQADNMYGPLRAMVQMGPFDGLLKASNSFVRILGGIGGDTADRIDVVTSSAQSRLGNPVSFVIQDETGTWTARNRMQAVAEAQRRGAAGMGGRTLQTTNAWDASEKSVAQQTVEAHESDVFVFYEKPPTKWSWMNLSDRKKILEYVYEGSPWVNINSVFAEANSISRRDPSEAERFFGNRVTYGRGSWLPERIWEESYAMAGQST